MEIEVWREVFLPWNNSDHVLIRLWACSKFMQQLMIKRSTSLTCEVRQALEEKDRYLHPHFLSQLTGLRHLKLIVPENTLKYMLVSSMIPKIDWKQIPLTLKTLDIPEANLLIDTGVDTGDVEDLTNLLLRASHLRIIGKRLVTKPGVVEAVMHQLKYNHQGLDSLRKELFGSVNLLTTALLIGLHKEWRTLNSDIKEWLVNEWCPYVAKVIFIEDERISNNYMERLQEWCWGVFPNITEVVGTVDSLPSSVQYHAGAIIKHSKLHDDMVMQILPPTLTRLNAKLSSSSHLPQEIPSTLTDLHLSISGVASNDDIKSFLLRLPVGLTRLCLVGRVGKVNITPERASLLPRGLKILEASLVRHVGDHLTWKELPPHLTVLTNFNSYELSDYDYQVISREITRIECKLVASGRIHPNSSGSVYLSTISLFSSLRSLTLIITSKAVLDDDFTSLPHSLRKLRLSLFVPSGEFLEKLVFPPFLKDLVIKLSGPASEEHIHCDQWQTLPSTLLSLTLSVLNITTLPLVWPTSLIRFNLLNILGEFHSLFVSIPLEQQLSNKLSAISHVRDSLFALPLSCLVCIGDTKRGPPNYRYILSDRKQLMVKDVHTIS